MPGNTVEKPFHLCFGGIELPEPYQSHFAQISQFAQTLFPGIKSMYPRVPGHVTASYLGDLTAEELATVGKVMAEHSPQLVGHKLKLSGLVIQNRRFAFRAFVQIDAPDPWHRFVEDVNSDLDGLTASHLNFFAREPHVTIGNSKTEKNSLLRLSLQFNQQLLMERANKMKGEIPLHELAVWGMDPADETRTQVRRQTIPLGGRNKRMFYVAQTQQLSA